MQDHPLYIAITDWAGFYSQLEFASLGYGFLSTLLAFTVVVELKTAMRDDFPRPKYILFKVTMLACYILSIFFAASFVTLSLPEYVVPTYSITGILLCFLILPPIVGGSIATLDRVNKLSTYRLGYSTVNTTNFYLVPLCFMILPQWENVHEAHLLNLACAYPITWALMYKRSKYACEAAKYLNQSIADRLKHILKVTLIMISVMLFMISQIEYAPYENSLSAWWMLPVSHRSYEVGLSILCFGMLGFLLFKVYSAVCMRVLGLESKTEILKEQKIQSEKVVEDQQKLIFQTTARLKELELSLQQGHSDSGICADSLITAVLNLEDGVFEWDLERHSLKLGPVWSSKLGISEHMDQAARVSHLSSGVLAEDWSNARLQISRILTGCSMQEQTQIRFTHASGQILKLDIRVAAVRNPYGLPTRLVGILTDRTQEMDVEHAIRRELTEESRLSKLKTDFVSYLSHEIRTPMTIITSANALLANDVRMNKVNPDRVQQFTDQVGNALGSLRSLVDETLDFVSISPQGNASELSTEPMSFRETLASVLDLESRRRYQNPAPQLNVVVSEDFPDQVWMDEHHVSQALRHFMVYVLHDLPHAALRLNRTSPQGIELRVEFDRKLQWIAELPVKSMVNEADQSTAAMHSMYLMDESLPFALLLTKRVIRNLNGRLMLYTSACENQTAYALSLEFPVASEQLCPQS